MAKQPEPEGDKEEEEKDAVEDEGGKPVGNQPEPEGEKEEEKDAVEVEAKAGPAQQPRMIPKTITMCSICKTPRNKPKMTLDLYKRALQETTTVEADCNESSVRKSKRDRSQLLVHTKDLTIPKKEWQETEGLCRAMKKHPVLADDEQNKLGCEKFSELFSVLDVKSVCTFGWFVPDKIVHALGTHFTSKADTPLFVEHPSFISSVVNLEILEPNVTGTHHTYPSSTHQLPIARTHHQV